MKPLWLVLSLLIAAVVHLEAQQYPPVYLVLFTHIEDTTPSGSLDIPSTRTQYVNMRSKLIEMAKLALRFNVQWSLQLDWKILLAALQYEDAQLIADTNGKNFLRYLKEDLSVVIDPHSHEKSGYNYTDVVHLLNLLDVGGSTVIGGHIWDPSLPQFANWDRFRNPVAGTKYPTTVWRGDILIGAGTPDHVNDPVVGGIWRPKNRFNYFVDDPNGNIANVGAYKKDLASISELLDFYRNGKVSISKILTVTYHIQPLSITAVGGLLQIEETVIKPLVEQRSRGDVILTDFTSLVQEWKTKFYGKAHIYDANNPPPDDGTSRLDHILLLPSGSVQFDLRGAPGSQFGVETSSNLVDWIPWQKTTNFQGQATFLDSRTADGERRFYRAIRMN